MPMPVARSFLFVVTLAAALAPAAAQSPVVALWKFDESSGTTVADIGPFGNTGTVVGQGATGSWSAGRFGNALLLDGIDDHVDIAIRGGLPIYRGDGSPFTIAFWVKAPAGNDRRVYAESLTAAGSGGGALFTLGSGRTSNSTSTKLQMYLRNDRGQSIDRYSVADVFDDAWHHVAYVDVSGDVTLYVDGVAENLALDHRNAANGPGMSGYGPFTLDRVALGAVVRSNVVARLTGALDELFVFGFALTASDVQALLVGTLPSACRASLGEFGVGCGPLGFDLDATGTAALGTGFTIRLANGPTNAPAFLLFGFGRVATVDLGLLGWAGCTLYPPQPLSGRLGTLDALGQTAPLLLSVPNDPALACQQVVLQGATVDPASLAVIVSDAVIAYFGT